MDSQAKIEILKQAIDTLLKGIYFALDENVTRKVVSRRLLESKNEAIKILKSASNKEIAK